MNVEETVARENKSAPPAGKGRKKKKQRLLSYLRLAIMALGCLILLLGLLLVILPLFRVGQIKVSGNEFYQTEDIIECSGVQIGEELLALDLDEIRNRLHENFEHAQYITVRSVFPNILSIELVEKEGLAYTAHNGSYYTFDSSFTVVDERSECESLAIFPYVELPAISYIALDEQIEFENESMDMSYVFELMEVLDKAGALPYVTLLDCERKYDSAVELNGNCRIEFGKVEEIHDKLALAQEILVLKGLQEGECAVVNVADPAKSTYRILRAEEFAPVVEEQVLDN